MLVLILFVIVFSIIILVLLTDHFSSAPLVFSCISSIEDASNIRLDSVWQLIDDSYEKFARSYLSLVFNKDNKQIFEELYREECANNLPLDSYKQAAIITICCLKADLVEHFLDNNKISIIPQLIAVHVGLFCMLDNLNSLNSISRAVQHYYFPVPFTDDSCYADDICWLLCHEQQANHFSVEWLASRYVLLESLNLSQHGINSIRVIDHTAF